MLFAHLLGAAIWAGGHLVLAVSVLPKALRARRAATITEFEAGFERIGLPALAVQVVSGLWLAERLLGSPSHWFDDTPLARTVLLKLGLLAATVALALHARLRLIPRLTDETLPALAAHIVAITVVAVALVAAGASIRLGGYPIFTR